MKKKISVISVLSVRNNFPMETNHITQTILDSAFALLINFGGERLKGNFERLVAGEAPDLKGSHGGR